MPVRAGVIAAALAAACSSTAPSPQDDGVIRLSSSIGLEPISPSVRATMTRNLLDLVYDGGEEHIARIDRDGQRFRLSLKPSTKIAPKVLAETLRFARLASAARDGNDLLVTSLDGEPPELADIFFDLGPFEQASYSPSKLVLQRRSGEGVQRIEVIAVPTQEEEWRRFLAREVDISAFMTPGTLTYLRDVPSVNVVRLERLTDVALLFSVNSPIFADPEMRRYVASRLRRPAIAQMAVGDRAAAAAPADPATADPHGRTIRLISAESAFDHQQAALVLEQQLIEMGFTVQLSSITAQDLQAVLQGKRFDAAVFFSGSGEFDATYAERYISDEPANIPGYSNPDYDAAVATGDLATAHKILVRDVPFTVLYRAAQAVAVDKRFCGVHPKVNYDFSWLADVHLCAPGEAQ